MCCKELKKIIEEEELIKVGDVVQYKKVIDGTRLGGAEPKRVMYISEYVVVFSITGARGQSLGESCLDRHTFDETMERC